MADTSIDVLPSGQQVVLVDRDQLRFAGKKQMTYSTDFQGFISQPTPPPAFDWSRGEAIRFPISGNDQVGNCYYVTGLNASRSFCGMNARPCEFNVADVIARYRRLSGGDNGLNDEQMMPEWKGGLVGPNGPHKILDDVQVDVHDDAAVALAMWAFGGLAWTTSLRTNWMPSRTHAGSIWAEDGMLNRRAGHAMWLTGKKENYTVRTWGLTPPVQVTLPGIKSSDSELLAVFSMEMFSDAGYAPCGLHYVDLAPLWRSIGGIQLPVSPFPVPAPEDVTYRP